MSRALAEIEVRRAVVIARPFDDVDIATAEPLKETIVAAVPNNALGLVIDLTRARYVDSAGIRVLFALATRLRMRQQGMRLVVPPDAPVRAILAMAGLDSAAGLHSDLDEAVAALADGAPTRTAGADSL